MYKSFCKLVLIKCTVRYITRFPINLGILSSYEGSDERWKCAQFGLRSKTAAGKRGKFGRKGRAPSLCNTRSFFRSPLTRTCALMVEVDKKKGSRQLHSLTFCYFILLKRGNCIIMLGGKAVKHRRIPLTSAVPPEWMETQALKVPRKRVWTFVIVLLTVAGIGLPGNGDWRELPTQSVERPSAHSFPGYVPGCSAILWTRYETCCAFLNLLTFSPSAKLQNCPGNRSLSRSHSVVRRTRRAPSHTRNTPRLAQSLV